MGFMEIIGLIGVVAGIITKAIPFVEGLFAGQENSGAAKSAIVMNMAQVAVTGVGDAVAANNPQWAVLAPLAQRFINDAIAAIKEIESQKG